MGDLFSLFHKAASNHDRIWGATIVAMDRLLGLMVIEDRSVLLNYGRRSNYWSNHTYALWRWNVVLLLKWYVVHLIWGRLLLLLRQVLEHELSRVCVKELFFLVNTSTYCLMVRVRPLFLDLVLKLRGIGVHYGFASFLIKTSGKDALTWDMKWLAIGE